MAAASGVHTGAVYVDPEMPVIGAGNLQPRKARLLLLLALAFSDDAEEVAGWFSTYGGQEFTTR